MSSIALNIYAIKSIIMQDYANNARFYAFIMNNSKILVEYLIFNKKPYAI